MDDILFPQDVVKRKHPWENKYFVATLSVFLVNATIAIFLLCSSTKSATIFTGGDSDETKIFKLVCYYSFIDEDTGGLSPQQIDANLCTHINVGFASVVNNTIDLSVSQLNSSKAIIGLKNINKNLKVLISVGGAGNDAGFPQMVQNHANRKQFIASVLKYVKVYKFDGVDLDWEFPNQHTFNDTRQRIHFTQLLYEIRKEINRQKKHKFLLSVAVAAPVFLIDNSYDVPYINEYTDFINLMSYDYHFYNKLTPFTGINAPLYASDGDVGYFATLNINYSANYWFEKGVDREKIIVGLPTYGHSYTLRNRFNNGLFAPTSGYGKLGQYGFIDFNQTCTFLNENKLKPVFDTPSRSPYATKDFEWISYDDKLSLFYKAEYVVKNNFGGVMVYSLNADDHRGLCDGNNNTETFPLIRTIRKVLLARNET